MALIVRTKGGDTYRHPTATTYRPDPCNPVGGFVELHDAADKLVAAYTASEIVAIIVQEAE